MKILMQNLSEVTDFIPDRIQILLTPYSASQAKVAIVYGGLVSHSYKILGSYKDERRAKEVTEDMLKKNESRERVYIMPEA